MRARRLLLLVGDEERELLFVGERHLYGRAESELAERLVEEGRFSVAFAEGGWRPSAWTALQGATYSLLGLLSLRWHPTLLEVLRIRGARVVRLEAGRELPLAFRLFLVLFWAFIALSAAVAAWLAAQGRWPVVLTALAVFLALVLLDLLLALPPGLLHPLDRAIGSWLLDSPEREGSMGEALLDGLRRAGPPRAMVVVGESHLEPLLERVRRGAVVIRDEAVTI